VLGLELGADDYITKPFSVRELTARVKAIFRRVSNASNEDGLSIISFGDITIDENKREVRRSGAEIDLPLKEYEILKLLANNKGNVVTREQLLEKVWGYEYFGETRTIDVHIRHIRQKIEDENNSPQYIETVRGVGYKLIVKGE
jgi:two-component system alkaline phosphatase synthesis response regulator PhoP